jgi:hypothetical protein
MNFTAQTNENTIILDQYKNIHLEFFTSETSTYSDLPLFKAFRSGIQGDQQSYLTYLRKSFDNAKATEVKKAVGKFLYFAYLDQGLRQKAKELDKNSEDINFNLYSNIVAKKADYPKMEVETLTNITEIDFDQFYFDATVNKNDTVRVFFDTCAPGIKISQDLVEKHNWQTDTSYYGYSTMPAMGITFKNYSVLLPNLKIGDFEFKNLPSYYSIMSEEQEKRLKEKGIEDHDILIGINVFEDLVDGVEFDFENGKLRLIKTLPELEDARPNFMMADAKPAVEFKLSGKTLTAFLDTGSPRHVLPDKLITEDNSYFKEKGNYGDFQYDIFYVKYDQVLNQDDVWLDTADYGGFQVSELFKIDALFGSFLGRTLAFDFRNRQASIR